MTRVAKLNEEMWTELFLENQEALVREIDTLVEELARWTNLPIMVKPNAGLPDPGGAGYDITADQFAEAMAELTELGVKCYGGCCGTTPEYIAKLCKALEGRTIREIPRTCPRRRVQSGAGGGHRPGAGHWRAHQSHRQALAD